MIKKKKISLFDFINYVFLFSLTLIILYPLYFTLIASFSEPFDVVKGTVTFWFKGFTIGSYENVFRSRDIWQGYRNSVVYTVAGTLLNLLLTIPAAYALSKKDLWMRNLITTYFLITMYFSGGLLPTYLIVKNIGLLNRPYTLIILSGFSVYNMVVTRAYFQTAIPEDLYEAAKIDGCTHFRQFFSIALPLARPIIAVITLYYAVGRWNNFYNSLIYVNSSKYYSLQLVLRNILLEGKNALSQINSERMSAEEMSYIVKQGYMAEAMKYSIIFIASLPMLILYPFIQKHFVKGVMVGSLKG